jgi:hypothetical protein
MVVLGGWYLYHNKEAVFSEPRLCQARRIRGLSIRVYWVDVDMLGYANEQYLTPLPEGLTTILSDSIRTGETND